HGRLAGLDSVEPRQDCARHYPADARYVAHALAQRDDRAVARRGADHLDERALAHAAADGAVVHVELADGDRDPLREAEAAGPRGAQAPRRDRGVMGPRVEA